MIERIVVSGDALVAIVDALLPGIQVLTDITRANNAHFLNYEAI